MADRDKFIDKVIGDASFAGELVANPEATLRAHGVDPTPEMIAALKGLDAANLQRLASAFGKQQAAF